MQRRARKRASAEHLPARKSPQPCLARSASLAHSMSSKVQPQGKLDMADLTADQIVTVKLALWSLVRLAAPVVVGQFVYKIMLQPGFFDLMPVMFVEYFAGKQAVTRALWTSGVACIPYDIVNDASWEDFTSPKGFAHALVLTLKMEIGAGALAAIVCGSWTRLNIATSRRTVLNPRVDEGVGTVAAGNLMASRLAILLMVMASTGIFWVIEQPVGSKLFEHPRMQQVLGTLAVYMHKTAM